VTFGGFEPVSRADARVLILGTLPGRVSLERREYYAQSRNVFWRIVEKLAGVSHELSYETRKLRLIEKGIALWDVCSSAQRSGSSDSTIQASTCIPNDFSRFLDVHTRIGLICFNGAKADKLYCEKVLPGLPRNLRDILRRRLPSSSSAYARISFEQKLQSWGVVLDELDGSTSFDSKRTRSPPITRACYRRSFISSRVNFRRRHSHTAISASEPGILAPSPHPQLPPAARRGRGPPASYSGCGLILGPALDQLCLR
jgi:double-stranded uracil-DNA glycosylase